MQIATMLEADDDTSSPTETKSTNQLTSQQIYQQKASMA